jgi:hypothetical protein
MADIYLEVFMVEEINKTLYVCPKCSYEHITMEDAEECLLGHCDIDEKLVTKFKCEMCAEEFKRRNQAQCCEDVHKKSGDKHYMIYVMRKTREKLDEAANHPMQLKINVWWRK